MNEDNPLCKGLFGTSRIELGLYKNDSPAVVAEELRVAASLFARTWDRIPEIIRDRTMVYGWPRLADRSLHWVAAQALHEVEHHLSDIRAGREGGTQVSQTNGGVPPFGHSTQLRVFVDPDLLQYDEVWAAA